MPRSSAAVGCAVATFDYVGGLVGWNDNTITYSYWDTETSGQSLSAGGTGKTTAEMKQQATFDNWDFTNIWAIEEGVTYPYLQWQPAAAEPPNIASFAPSTSVSNIAEATRTFNITVDQTVNVTWYINGTNVQDTNTSVEAANYTNTSAEIGVWNVSALAKNANGTAMQTWIWNVTGETTPRAITIDAPTQSVPVRIPGGEQFWVNFTYTELNPANYTVTIRNATAVINSTTNVTVVGGTDMTANESFYLNASAANGWYNVTVEMYDNSLNHNIMHQNHSVAKESYNASIPQPENQTTEPGVNATYTLAITNTGSFACTFELAVTNHDTADVATLNQTMITNLASGSSQNVTLNVTDVSAGRYNVTVNVTSTYSGSKVAETGYIMTTVGGLTLTLGNVTDITSDWGRSFNLNHSVTVTNATASNVNVTYNVPWITDITMGTIAKDETKWHNQTRSNSTILQIMVRMNANSTNTSVVNDTETFLLNITKRDINITSYPPATQTFKPDTTFWINAIVEGEYGETFIGNATLVRNGIVVDTPKAVIDGNASFNRTESTIGTYDFSIRFYNLTYYFNTSTDNSTVSVANPPPNGGGGSGGGSGGISDEPENVEETVFLRIYLRAGSSSSYNFNNVVTSIEVTPNKTYGLVGAKIEILHGQPGSITTDLPAGIVYKYFNIFVGNLGWSEGKFSNSVVNFQVPASWFEEYNIDTASVTLYRHYDGEWQPLKTTITGLEGEYYQYSSPTPGFGTFVILGKVEGSGTVQPVATADFGTVADPTPEAISTSTKRTPIFEILLVIIGIGILMAVYLRRK